MSRKPAALKTTGSHVLYNLPHFYVAGQATLIIATGLLFECKSIALYSSIGHLLGLDSTPDPSIPNGPPFGYTPEVPFNDYQQRG